VSHATRCALDRTTARAVSTVLVHHGPARSGAQNAGPRRPIDAEASVQGRSGGPATVSANLGESFAI
jgi:hypothetical protein